MNDHVDNYPYPLYQQAAPSFSCALQIVTGQCDLPLHCKIKTLHTVGSFALGMVFPCDHEVTMTDDLAALASWAEPGTDAMRGIDWKKLGMKLLQFLLSLMVEDQ